MPHNTITLTEDDAYIITRLSGRTKKTISGRRVIRAFLMPEVNDLYERNFDECCGVVKRALILAQYESRFGE